MDDIELNIDRISKADIDHAVSLPTLNQTVRYLQNIAGINSGDVAGHCFHEEDWVRMTESQRRLAIDRWLATERLYA